MREMYFEDNIDDSKYCGHLYGLGTTLPNNMNVHNNNNQTNGSVLTTTANNNSSTNSNSVNSQIGNSINSTPTVTASTD